MLDSEYSVIKNDVIKRFDCITYFSLFQSAIHVSHDFMGCSTLKKYFAQLQFLQGRFPMTEGGEAAIPFTW